MKSVPTVLITNANGGIGQGVIRILRKSSYKVRIIGIVFWDVSAVNHLVDALYKAPSSYSLKNGIDISFIEMVCLKESVRLIIPTTDIETVELTKKDLSLPTVACSNHVASQIFFDKWQTYQYFEKANIPFAKSVLPSKYSKNLGYNRTIVKPRKGGLSKYIHFDPPNPSEFSDDYLVQELVEGTELTCSFYVDKNKKIHSQIVMARNLFQGMTFFCTVVREFDAAFYKINRDICDHFDISGSCNVQAIATDDKIIPFEINCRVSGASSLRHEFGFKDIQWIIEEAILGILPSPATVTTGTAVRMLRDIIYLGLNPEDILRDTNAHYYYAS